MAASTEKISPSPPASSAATLISAEIPETPLSAIGIDGGDWICGDGDCKNVNFGRRTQCNKCHREKSSERVVSGTVKKKLGTEIGKAAAEKSRGLFSAEDWQCSKCANVNWARRQTCNMCNAPKFCDVEERTGYGGGYNDRGIVEYKDRSESDSDYDEFGRRKKKIPKMSVDPKASGTRGDDDEYTEDDKNEEDDDDDEDDGDGDLSKYDLWGDDEVVAASKKALNKENSHSAQSPKSSVKRSSSSTSSSGSKSATRSRSKSSTSSYSSSSTPSENNKPKKRRNSSRSKSRNRSRDRSKTHSTTSSRKSNRKFSRSGSRSKSPSRAHRSRDYKMHSSRHGNSHSSSSSSRGPERDIKKRAPPRSRTRSRSPRSRSSSRNRRDVSKASKYKRNNSSHSPRSSSQTASSRYRRRSRSKSLSVEKKRH